MLVLTKNVQVQVQSDIGRYISLLSIIQKLDFYSNIPMSMWPPIKRIYEYEHPGLVQWLVNLAIFSYTKTKR